MIKFVHALLAFIAMLHPQQFLDLAFFAVLELVLAFLSILLGLLINLHCFDPFFLLLVWADEYSMALEFLAVKIEID